LVVDWMERLGSEPEGEVELRLGRRVPFSTIHMPTTAPLNVPTATLLGPMNSHKPRVETRF